MEQKVIYLDCGMGAAGDMLAGALIELLPDPDQFVNDFNALGIPEVTMELVKTQKCGITGTKVKMLIQGKEEHEYYHTHRYAHEHSHSHDHGHEHHHDHEHEHEHACEHDHSHDHGHGNGYAYEHEHEHHHDHEHEHEHWHEHSHDHAYEHDHLDAHTHEHGHNHEHNHAHEHSTDHTNKHSHGGEFSHATGHSHDHSHDQHIQSHDHIHEHSHEHSHTGMVEIREILEALPVSERVRQDALNVYELIAEAESKAHDKPSMQIHFHEVGTLDAVADVTAVCMLIERLSADKIMASPVHVGSGKVHCAHGILPVPAPATAHILRGVPIYGGDIRGELCTPTGAALLKYFVNEFGGMPVLKVDQIGYGMGTKDFPAANCLRAFIGWQVTDGRTAIVKAEVAPEETDSDSIGIMNEGAGVAATEYKFAGVESVSAVAESKPAGVESTSAADASRSVGVESTSAADASRSVGVESASATDASRFAGVESASAVTESKSAGVESASAVDESRSAGVKSASAAAASRSAGVESVSFADETGLLQLECNIDDMTGEQMGFAMEEILKAGAKEVFTTAVGMKKSRPGILLTVICRTENRQTMVETIFRHTTTIGMRETAIHRHILRRSLEQEDTPFGPVTVKRSSGYGVERKKFEYEELAEIAREKNLSLQDVLEIIRGK